jgi:hypothetical protein
MGFKPSGTNLINSPKFSLEMVFTKVNLVGHTCMQENLVSTQVSKWLSLNKRKEFWFEIQTSQNS